MRILIASPKIGAIQTGNQMTARAWAAILSSLGHEIFPLDSDRPEPTPDADLLVALHAEKSAAAGRAFRAANPAAKVVVALTGTDIYPAPSGTGLASMRLADALVGLQDKAAAALPADLRDKVHVIVQAAPGPPAPPPERDTAPFRIGVVGHLRAVKDPMLAAEASRRLPPESKIQIEHAGAILEPEFELAVAREGRENPRYRYLGELPDAELAALFARCQATVVSSHAEGGARVVGESIAAGTPVLATRIDGVTGLVGDTYPGLFPVGDAAALAGLMRALESDPGFRSDLARAAAALAPRFAPETERAAWAALLDSLASR